MEETGLEDIIAVVRASSGKLSRLLDLLLPHVEA
jgi:hypothetical protein